MSFMSWWDSFETLSRLQTALAILVSALSVVTLTVKLRADRLKKHTDALRAAERAKLDKELKDKTAEALRATTALELAARPRSLTAEQITAFTAKLADAPRGTVQIQYSDAADDGYLLAHQVYDAINAAGGYNLSGDIQSVTVLSTGKPGEGIGINTNRSDNEVAIAIQNAFKAIGIEAPGQLKSQQAFDVIVLVYRKKP